MLDLKLADKVAIVTGGAGGIGSACVKGFLDQNACVVVADKAWDRQQEAALRHRYGDRVMFARCDLRRSGEIRALVEGTIERFGGIDCLICNAGTFPFTPLLRWGPDDLATYEDHFRVGLKGHVDLVRTAWQLSERSRAGSVVTIGSTAGQFAEPQAFAYLTVKAALIGAVKQFAFEMAEFGGWSVCVSPGHTFTRQHIMKVQSKQQSREEYEASAVNVQNTLAKRFLEPEEIATCILFAASPHGKALTGSMLQADAGIAAGGFNSGYERPPTASP